MGDILEKETSRARETSTAGVWRMFMWRSTDAEADVFSPRGRGLRRVTLTVKLRNGHTSAMKICADLDDQMCSAAARNVVRE